MKEVKDINQLVQINSDGVYTARFADIRDCLEVKFKEIYGIDVDTDPATADGQYINMWALLINNLFQLIQYGYKQTDPTTATGEYLDLLCAFNNIRRTEKSRSKVNLWVKNVNQTAYSDIENLEFIDQLGRRWKWTNPTEQFAHQKAIKFPAATSESASTTLIRNVECLTDGPIIINGAGEYDKEKDLKDWKSSLKDLDDHGFLRLTENNDVKFYVWQEKDSIPGENEESDDELRVRRNDYFRNANSSVIDTLKGNLLALDGIEDCFIYENDSKDPANLHDLFNEEGKKDTQTVSSHSIYICLKYDYGDKNANYISDYDIGNLIYSKLIPGCRTCKYTNTVNKSGETKEYHVKTNNETVTYPIYWKKVYDVTIDSIEGAGKGIRIVLKCVKENENGKNGYNFATKFDDASKINKINTESHHPITDVEKNIANKIVDYLNNIKIGETINAGVLSSVVASADIKKNNNSTFFIESTKINTTNSDGGGSDNYILPLCTLHYNAEDVLDEHGSPIINGNISFQYINPESDPYYVKCVIFVGGEAND